MKKLLLIGALLCGSAQAVALNTLKMEDVCIEIEDTWMRLGDAVGTEYGGRLPNLEFALKKLTDFGFKTGTKCTYTLSGYSDITLIGSSISIVHYLYLYSPSKVDKITGINVSTGYIVPNYLESDSVAELNNRQLLIWDAMFTTFLNDWKASHPK